MDSSASHNFIKKELESELRLRVGTCGASVKEINYKIKESIEVTSIVHILLDKWKSFFGRNY